MLGRMAAQLTETQRDVVRISVYCALGAAAARPGFGGTGRRRNAIIACLVAGTADAVRVRGNIWGGAVGTQRRSAGCDTKVLQNDGRHIEGACCRAVVIIARDGIVCYDFVRWRVQQLFVRAVCPSRGFHPS